MALNLIGGIVGKILPEAGKIIDDLHTSAEEKMAARQKMEELLVSAEQEAQKEVSARWDADLKSDAWLPKNIRPLTLIFLTVVFVIISVFDGNIGQFSISEAYVPVYQTLLMVVYSAYFAGRSIEKVKGKSGTEKTK
jgi:hypothetical protein|tara:strand:+ start:2867 stop:3277 length:411 start_codon:yes stop_codon:yes gene_type:complete